MKIFAYGLTVVIAIPFLLLMLYSSICFKLKETKGLEKESAIMEFQEEEYIKNKLSQTTKKLVA